MMHPAVLTETSSTRLRLYDILYATALAHYQARMIEECTALTGPGNIGNRTRHCPSRKLQRSSHIWESHTCLQAWRLDAGRNGYAWTYMLRFSKSSILDQPRELVSLFRLCNTFCRAVLGTRKIKYHVCPNDSEKAANPLHCSFGRCLQAVMVPQWRLPTKSESWTGVRSCCSRFRAPILGKRNKPVEFWSDSRFVSHLIL